jgi:hypothetical protein
VRDFAPLRQLKTPPALTFPALALCRGAMGKAPPIRQAPGAGLPWLQRLLFRQAGPFVLHAFYSWHKSETQFSDETQRLLELCGALGETPFSTPVLIPRLMGMEDSSRQWSCEMTLEHLMLVGAVFESVIVDLSHFRRPTIVIDTAVVKPTGGLGRVRYDQFAAWSLDFPRRVLDALGPDRDQTRHLHPWLGPLNAEQWFALSAVHQTLHRRQVELILAGL